VITYCGYTHANLSVHRVSTMSDLASFIICMAIGCSHSYVWHWLALWAKQRATHPLPHFDNECQQRVKEFGTSKSGNSKVIRLLLYIIKVLAAIWGKQDSDTLPATSWKWVSTERQQCLALHHGWSKSNPLVIVSIQCFDCLSRLQRSWTLSFGIKNEICCDCLGGCRRNVAYLAA